MEKKKIKLIIIMLIVVILTMVGYLGVYSMSKGHMENNVKDYSYMTNIKGARVANFEVSTSTKNVVKDADGNVIKDATAEEIEEKGYVTVEEPINIEGAKTAENFETVKNIIKARIEKLGAKDYIIRLDEETGKIILELPENDDTDNILTALTITGKFEIVDAETKEVLISKDDIETSNIFRNRTESGVEISFSIEFNSEGAKKFEDLTKKYTPAQKKEKTENTTTEQTTTENTTTESAATENTTTESAATEQTTDIQTNEDEAAQKDKQVTFVLDGEDLMSTTFTEPVTTGKMYLTVGQAATTTEEARSNYNQARRMATALSTKTMPLTYTNSSSTFVQGTKNETMTNKIVAFTAIAIAIVIVGLTLKYKLQGLLTGLGFAGFTALLLLTVRYWNVDLSLEGVIAIFGVMALNVVFVNKILNDLVKEKDNKKAEPRKVINKAFLNNTIKLIPLFLIAVVFSFAGWEATVSFGMVTFWGIALMELYNILITKSLLKNSIKE